MNNKHQLILLCISCILIIALSLTSIVSNIISPKSFSETENRPLANFPSFSLATLKDSFSKDLTAYATDHFALRDNFINLYTTSQKLTGKKLISGVYTLDDYLVEAYPIPTNTDKIIKKLNALKDKLNISADIMLIPTSISYNQANLPSYADTKSQLETFKIYKNELNYNFIDVSNSLDYTMFYRTDHHWSTYGAYEAYKQFCISKKLTPTPIDAFDITTVSDSFLGSLYSKVIDNSIKPDIITAFYQKDLDITASFSHKKTVNSLYNEDYLSKKDKYSFFLDNQNDIIEIHNNKLNNNKRLLIAKDSYANCFVPFLVNHYEDIIVIDTRYYINGISDYITNSKVTDFLILYNLNTIDSDTGIAGLY